MAVPQHKLSSMPSLLVSHVIPKKHVQLQHLWHFVRNHNNRQSVPIDGAGNAQINSNHETNEIRSFVF